ncbi:hypothetical protein SUGI_0172040 [Cryptomeria japonica]|nr:hypothetical protein SUGI_0172040 [Cryptomeria japonica]
MEIHTYIIDRGLANSELYTLDVGRVGDVRGVEGDEGVRVVEESLKELDDEVMEVDGESGWKKISESPGTNPVDCIAYLSKTRPPILSANKQKHPSSVNIWIGREQKYWILKDFASDKLLCF